MTDTKHTLTPLEVHRGDDYIRILKPGTHTDDYVAEIADSEYADVLAAAPDLLEALEGLLIAYKNEVLAGVDHHSELENDGNWKQASAAIKKATGQ